MTEAQIQALRGLVLAVLAALVGAGVIDAGASATVTGIITALLTAAAAFFVTPPHKTK